MNAASPARTCGCSGLQRDSSLDSGCRGGFSFKSFPGMHMMLKMDLKGLKSRCLLILSRCLCSKHFLLVVVI